MRGLNSETFDLIYLDPPFNSNANYAAPIGSEAAGAEFKDTWGLNDIDVAWCEQIGQEQPGLYYLIQSVKQIHGDSMMSYLIYMAPRLMEMHRLLKDTGSIYLHCDPTASHYLKIVMDSVFGRNQFRNEIIWQRASGRAKGSQHRSRSLGRDCDYVLHYSKTDNFLHNYVVRQLSKAEMKEKFPLVDEKGRRYNTATPLFCQPSMGSRPNLCYTYKGVTNPHPSGWRVKKEVLEKMDKEGRIIWRKGKRPLRKTYADGYKGKPVGSLWTDIGIASGKERTGYPTQKPLKLLERIIQASSNPGHMVLDPFCGCATTCVAAEKLNREWVGIDISELAAKLVQSRMIQETNLYDQFAPIHREDQPRRNDLGALRPYNHPENKQDLYGKQSGDCNGCEAHFEARNLEIDHIVPVSRGGTDHIENLQLLCGNCNRIKGNRPNEYLFSQLRRLGLIDSDTRAALEKAIKKRGGIELLKEKGQPW